MRSEYFWKLYNGHTWWGWGWWIFFIEKDWDDVIYIDIWRWTFSIDPQEV